MRGEIGGAQQAPHSAHTLEKGAVYSIFGQILEFSQCSSDMCWGFWVPNMFVRRFLALTIHTETLVFKKSSFLGEIRPFQAEI